MRRSTRGGAAVAAAAVFLALWAGGCDVGGTPTGVHLSGDSVAASLPGDSAGSSVPAGRIEAGISADDPSASPGAVVTLTARLTRGADASTPTGFVVSLHYDPSTLEPLSDATPAGSGSTLRTVNLHAAPGTVKAAGAAPDGLASDELFAVRMRVTKAGWKDGLSLDVGELDVVENDFADVASSVVVAPLAGR